MYKFCRTIVWVFLLVVALGSCQRASYLSQEPPYLAAREPAILPAKRPVVLSQADSILPASVSAHQKARQRLPKLPAKIARKIGCVDCNLDHKPVLDAARKQPGMRRTAAAFQANADPAPLRSNALAVGLALVFGILGAHLFYLGYSRRAASYLTITVLCVALAILAPIIADTIAGTGLGAVLIEAFLILIAFNGVVVVYLQALYDVYKILTGRL